MSISDVYREDEEGNRKDDTDLVHEILDAIQDALEPFLRPEHGADVQSDLPREKTPQKPRQWPPKMETK